jgi:hypothetical protein
MDIRAQGLSASELAEHVTMILQNEPYRRQLKWQMRLGVSALLIGTAGALLSVWLLLRLPLSNQAAQFWFLCLILSAGLFCVAVLTLASSFTTHLAMQRLALGNKDIEVFEATREKEEVLLQIQALVALIEEARTNHREPDYELLEQSLQFICRADSLPEMSEYPTTWKSIAERWKAKGVSSEKLNALKTPQTA